MDVPEVGWLDPDFGDAYDMCEANPYGNHLPGRPGGAAAGTPTEGVRRSA
ncbi:hypothetical protein [Nocardioides ferulae]|nr:hypothetical protein [Nocardioides ferulae]